MKTSKPKAVKYQIALTMGDKTIKGSGETALEALQSIVRPVKVTTKGFLKITEGKKKAEMMLQPVRIKRLFYPLAQNYLAKQLSYLMR